MRLPKIVQIVTIKKQYDDIGQYVGDIETLVKEFKAEVQPYSSVLAEKEYGTSVKVNNRMFCYPVSELELGIILKYNDEKYLVTQFFNFEKHYEVLLELQS